MKRIIVRISVLCCVIVFGLIAIARAQRSLDSAKQDAPAKLSTRATRAATPIPTPKFSTPAPAGDPFAAARSRIATASEEMSRESRAIETTPRQGTGGREEAESAYTEVPDDAPSGRTMYGVGVNNETTAAEDRGIPTRDRAGADPFSRRSPSGGQSDGYPVRQTAGEELAPPPRQFDESTSRREEEPSRFDAQEGSADLRDERNGEQGDFAVPERASSDPATAGQPQDPGDASFAQPNDSAQSQAGEGTGRPGASQLDGAQSPALTIQKLAPPEIQVGKPATFTIKVRNVGTAMAEAVEVHDEVPKGTQLVSTKPNFSPGRDGKLIWSVGTLKPGDEVQAEIELMPIAEGEVGSVATVHFQTAASVRTVCTKPQLAIEIAAPSKIMIGEDVALKIKITNSGTGAATGLVIREEVPKGLKHASGSELEFEVGTLKPGETRELELALSAAEPGLVHNVITARGDANVQAEAKADFEVIAPALKLTMTGPKRRYLERSATYNISVSNPGTAAAKEIELVTVLPKGLKFAAANNQGQYDMTTHSVYWSLAELPAQETGSVTLTALPIEAGDQKLQIKGQAKQGLKDELEETVVVEGLAAILFELVDVQDPIEVGGETTYEIRVINQGSKAASNVQLVAILPAGLKALSADGPVKHTIDRNKTNDERVFFEPLAQLAPKADTTFSIKVKGTSPGDQRIEVKLQSDEVRDPISKQESTRVYSDE